MVVRDVCDGRRFRKCGDAQALQICLGLLMPTHRVYAVVVQVVGAEEWSMEGRKYWMELR